MNNHITNKQYNKQQSDQDHMYFPTNTHQSININNHSQPQSLPQGQRQSMRGIQPEILIQLQNQQKINSQTYKKNMNQTNLTSQNYNKDTYFNIFRNAQRQGTLNKFQQDIENNEYTVNRNTNNSIRKKNYSVKNQKNDYYFNSQQKVQKMIKKSFLSKLVIQVLFVTRFIKMLKSNVQGRYALRSLNSQQLDTINDKAHYYLSLEEEKHQKQEQEKQKSYFLQCLIQKIPIVQPNQIFKMIFDCQQSYWILFRIYFTTIKLFFFITDIRESLDIIKDSTYVFINFSFWIDMVMNLFTGYYDNGIIVLDRKLIALKYLKGNLKTDILAQVPLVVALFTDNKSSFNLIVVGYILEFLIFFKIYSLTTTFNRLERVLTENPKAAGLWPLVRLIVNVLILGHIVGSVFYGIAIMQKELWNEQQTWLDILDIYGEGWFYSYLYAIFWAFSTMVSNSVYIPITKTELIYSLIMILVMTGTFGYVINTVGQIMSEIELKTKNQKLERERTNRFMQQKQIPEKLRERISLYLDYVHSQEKEKNKEEEALVLSKLSDQLKKEILQFINYNNIKKFKQINDNFSPQSLSECLLIIKELIYSQGDIIFSQCQEKDGYIEDGQIDQELNSNLYVIQKGEVQICQENKDDGQLFVVKVLKEGDQFGDNEFFTGQQRMYTAKVSQSCSLLKINFKQFYEIIQKSQEDMQIFQMIKDQIIQYKTSKYNPISCMFCYQQGHFSDSCPRAHLKVDIKQIIHLYNNCNLQVSRTDFERIFMRSHHALADLEEIQFGLDILQGDQQQDEIQYKNQNIEYIENNQGGSQYINLIKNSVQVQGNNYFKNQGNYKPQNGYINSIAKNANSQITQMQGLLQESPQRKKQKRLTTDSVVSNQTINGIGVQKISPRQQKKENLENSLRTDGICQNVIYSSLKGIKVGQKQMESINNSKTIQEQIRNQTLLPDSEDDSISFDNQQFLQTMNVNQIQKNIDKSRRLSLLQRQGQSDLAHFQQQQNKNLLNLNQTSNQKTKLKNSQISGSVSQNDSFLKSTSQFNNSNTIQLSFDKQMQIINDFDKKRNWQIYWPIHNFSNIQLQLPQYFRQKGETQFQRKQNQKQQLKNFKSTSQKNLSPKKSFSQKRKTMKPFDPMHFRGSNRLLKFQSDRLSKLQSQRSTHIPHSIYQVLQHIISKQMIDQLPYLQTRDQSNDQIAIQIELQQNNSNVNQQYQIDQTQDTKLQSEEFDFSRVQLLNN